MQINIQVEIANILRAICVGAGKDERDVVDALIKDRILLDSAKPLSCLRFAAERGVCNSTLSNSDPVQISEACAPGPTMESSRAQVLMGKKIRHRECKTMQKTRTCVSAFYSVSVMMPSWKRFC